MELENIKIGCYDGLFDGDVIPSGISRSADCHKSVDKLNLAYI
jgi:hypothetical protein